MVEEEKTGIYNRREAAQVKPGRKVWRCSCQQGQDDKEGLHRDHEGTALLQIVGRWLVNRWKCCITY